MKAAKSSSEELILTALASRKDATAVELAESAGLGRSTSGKLLVRLERSGRVRRSGAGREGGRRLPDRWSLVTDRRSSRRRSRGERLRRGQLDELVLNYLAEHRQGAPLGPTAIANGLGRSAGAVGNCLARLAAAGRVRQVGERPRRYRLG